MTYAVATTRRYSQQFCRPCESKETVNRSEEKRPRWKRSQARPRTLHPIKTRHEIAVVVVQAPPNLEWPWDPDNNDTSLDLQLLFRHQPRTCYQLGLRFAEPVHQGPRRTVCHFDHNSHIGLPRGVETTQNSWLISMSKLRVKHVLVLIKRIRSYAFSRQNWPHQSHMKVSHKNFSSLRFQEHLWQNINHISLYYNGWVTAQRNLLTCY